MKYLTVETIDNYSNKVIAAITDTVQFHVQSVLGLFEWDAFSLEKLQNCHTNKK